MSDKRPKKKVLQLIFENGCVCVYCEKELEWEQVTLDHIIPKSRGGSDNIENLAISCGSCNSSKKNKSLSEFKIHRSLKEVVPSSEISFGESGLTIRTKTTDIRKNIEILQSVVARLGILEL